MAAATSISIREDGTLKRRARAGAATEGFEVVVVEGPDAGARALVAAPSATTIFVGRSETCALRLVDGNVALRHCSLQLAGAYLRLIDLSSTKSTLVNDVRVSEGLLVGGEQIRIGQNVLAVARVTRRDEAVAAATIFGRMLAESEAMRDLVPTFEAAAQARTPFLIEGERGTGKSLLAAELVAAARRRGEESVTLEECDDIDAPGHSRVDEVLAAVAKLDGAGTLLVEEVRSLDPDAQRTLAEALAHTKTRIIATTVGPARGALVPELAAIFDGDRRTITLPPLRERRGDVRVLADHFWADLGGEGAAPDEVIDGLEEHDWPGNVRELRLLVFQGFPRGAASASASPSPSAHEDALARIIDRGLPFGEARDRVMEEFQRRYVERALARSGHHIGRAASASGITHRYFQTLRAKVRRSEGA